MGTIFSPAQFSSLVATQWLFIIWITVVRLCLNSVIGFVHFWPFFPSSSSSFLFSIHFLFAFFLLLVPFCVCVFLAFYFFHADEHVEKWLAAAYSRDLFRRRLCNQTSAVRAGVRRRVIPVLCVHYFQGSSQRERPTSGGGWSEGLKGEKKPTQ